MKHADIEKIHEAGLITDEQRDRIVAHFGLKPEGNKFLAIISFIGAALVVAGLVLLISANWSEIPSGVKIAVGIALMLGAHGAGWWLREVRRDYRKTGEALHLIGSCLFLGNIALVGQIYHLVSRPPNALLLWWAGIAALPWLLKSKAQHILVLLAFGVWFGVEINQTDSLIFFGRGGYQILLYALLGLIYLGFGYALRQTAFADFSRETEQLGLFIFLGFSFPLTLGFWDAYHAQYGDRMCAWIFPAMAAVAVALAAVGVRKLKELEGQWRLTWLVALAGAVGLLALQNYFAPESGWLFGGDTSDGGFHWIAVIALFVFCMVQIQVGVMLRSPSVVNLGIAFIAADIVVTYFRLIGTMARTGVMFLISGVFLIAFAVFLEKRRRALMQRIKSAAPSPEVKS